MAPLYPIGPAHPRTAHPIDPTLPQRWDLLLLVAAGLILVSAARLHLFVPVLPSLRPALILMAAGAFALWRNHRGPRRPALLKGPLGNLLAFIVIWAAIGAPFALWQGRAMLSILEQLFPIALCTVVVASSVRNAVDLERLLKTFAAGAVVFSFLATGGGGMGDVRGGGYDPNDSAMFVSAAIPLVAYFLVRARTILARIFFGGGLVFSITAVVMSGSRGGFLALAVVLIYLLVFLKGVNPLFRIATVGGAVLLIAATGTAEWQDRMETIWDEDDYNRHSLTGRMNLWTRGMGYMAENPLFGVGINNFTVAEGRHPDIVAVLEAGRGVRFTAPHSVWIQAGAELGPPALLAFILFFLVAFRFLLRTDRLAGRRSRGDPELRRIAGLARPLGGMLLALAVAGTFLSQAYSGMLWLTFGLVLAVAKLLKHHRARARRDAGAWGSPVPMPMTAAARVAPFPPRHPLPGDHEPARPFQAERTP